MAEWTNTIGAANSLSKTVTEGWSQEAFGVQGSRIDAPDISNIGVTATSGYKRVAAQLRTLGDNASGIFEADQYTDVADAAASASLSFLESKIQRIKDAWNTKDNITLGALMGEVAPYAVNFKDATKTLSSKLENLLNYLLGTSGDNWLSSLSDLGTQALNSITSDPSLTSAVSNLKAVQTYGSILSTMAEMVNTAQNIMKVVEASIPMVTITVNLVSAWVTGGASAGLAGSQLTEYLQQQMQKLAAMTIQPVKKLIFGVKIQVPSLLTGALKTISVREAVLSKYKDNDWYNIIEGLFNEDFYQTTIMSLNYESAIDKALSETLGTLNDLSQFKYDEGNGLNSQIGSILRNNLMSKVVCNYMYGSEGAIARAREAAHLPALGSLSTIDIVGINNRGSDSTTSRGSMLDTILNSDLGINPVGDELSIQSISKKEYDYIV